MPLTRESDSVVEEIVSGKVIEVGSEEEDRQLIEQDHQRDEIGLGISQPKGGDSQRVLQIPAADWCDSTDSEVSQLILTEPAATIGAITTAFNV